MHPDETPSDAALVRRLVAAQFPQWAELAVVRLGSFGTDNVLYRLGEDMVVRLPRRQLDAVRLEKERVWLPRLAPALPLAVPAPVALGRPGEGYPFEWSVYRWLPGEPATIAPIVDLHRAAGDLARFLAALQAIDATDAPRPGPHNAWRGEPLVARAAATRSAIAKLRGVLDADAATDAWEAALRAPGWQGAPVWIHGDLDARNLLVVDGRLSAVIDFGCLGVGDPACDAMVAWKVLSAETRDAFRAALPIDDATWARGRGWALSQAVAALSYYTTETNPELVGEADRWLAEVLADHAFT
jgi:aminoglycoside phosphotransferase (APT) family kinase protein